MPGKPAEIDQRGGRGEAVLDRRQQRHAAGERAGLGAGEQRHRLGEPARR